MLGYVPPNPLYGTQRYILLLFEQLSPGTFPARHNVRGSWDLAGWLQTNEGKIRPVAMNFFYVKNSKKA